MYTFLFCAGSAGESEGQAAIVRRALESVACVVPELGSAPSIVVREIPRAGGAFGTLLPTADRAPSLIQFDDHPELVTVTFGSIAGVAQVAAKVREVFLAGGVTAIERLDANLSAIVVEKRTRKVRLVSTLIGLRTLRYSVQGATLWVSPNDLPLLASGRVPLVVDYGSVACIAACDWSLLGRPLTRSIECADPLQSLLWHHGALHRRASAAFDLDSRLEARDDAGIQQQLEVVASAMEDAANRFVGTGPEVHSALTAGMDSRMVWALLAGAVGPEQRLVAHTSGAERSLDVRVATKLADLVGARHERTATDPPTAEDFESSSRLLAFFMNGDTNAKRAFRRAPTVSPHHPPQAGGNGGEIFRGFFYPYFGALGSVPNDLERIEATLLRWRFRRFANIPFAEPEFAESVRQRLHQAVERYSLLSKNGHDIVDLLYLFERYGRWGSMNSRMPWSTTWTPFESTVAIRAAYRLPPPIGKISGLHSLLIKRHLPRSAFLTPINGGQFLFLEGPGKVRYALRQTLNVRAFVANKLQRRLNRSARTKDDQIAGFIASDLQDQVRALLCDTGSVCRELLGTDGVEKVLSVHSQNRSELQLLGFLMGIEQWHRLALEVTTRGSRA